MQVSNILKGKQTAGVVTVPPDMPVSEAARILTERGIGTVVVSADGIHADGILSERDIVRELAYRGARCLEDTVEIYMTSELVTCSLTDSADHVLSRMTEGRFRHMPVVDNGEMVALISLGDVVKAQLNVLAMERDALEGMLSNQW
jgi:CBS domain-containing protein